MLQSESVVSLRGESGRQQAQLQVSSLISSLINNLSPWLQPSHALPPFLALSLTLLAAGVAQGGQYGALHFMISLRVNKLFLRGERLRRLTVFSFFPPNPCYGEFYLKQQHLQFYCTGGEHALVIITNELSASTVTHVLPLADCSLSLTINIIYLFKFI